MSRYEGLIVYALFYRLSPLRVAFAYGWVFIETTIPTWIYVYVSLSYDLPQKPKPPWKSTTRFRVWHLSVRRYHQAYKSLFVYVSLAGFGHICPFFSTFCHFFTRTCEAHLLHIYTCSTYTFDFFDFCRTFCGFFRRANCRLPTQNLV